MPAANLDFIIQQGETWSRILTWKDPTGTPINLSGYTAKMQIRVAPGTAVLLEFNTTPATGKADIALGGALGTITLTASATLTTALNFTGAPIGTGGEGGISMRGQLGVYDLELTNGGAVTKLTSGTVCFVKEITV